MRLTVMILMAGVAVSGAVQGVPFSQHGSVSQRVSYTNISVDYKRPVARGRTLFGSLVKWDSVWHPGADSAFGASVRSGSVDVVDTAVEQ